jgi:hypothetical protein
MCLSSQQSSCTASCTPNRIVTPPTKRQLSSDKAASNGAPNASTSAVSYHALSQLFPMRHDPDEEAWFRATDNDPTRDPNYWNFQGYMHMPSPEPIANQRVTRSHSGTAAYPATPPLVYTPAASPQAAPAQSSSPATALMHRMQVMQALSASALENLMTNPDVQRTVSPDFVPGYPPNQQLNPFRGQTVPEDGPAPARAPSNYATAVAHQDVPNPISFDLKTRLAPDEKLPVTYHTFVLTVVSCVCAGATPGTAGTG